MRRVTWLRFAVPGAALLAAGAGVAVLAGPTALAQEVVRGPATLQDSAAAGQGDFEIAQELQLARGGGRYTGDLLIRIRYAGATPVAYTEVNVTAPAGLWLVSTNTDEVAGCMGSTAFYSCSGPAFEPGQVRRYRFTFASWAGADTRARITTPGTITVIPRTVGTVKPAGPAHNSQFQGVLRGTRGARANPVTYTPSTDHDTSISAGSASVQPNADGSLLVTIPLRVGNQTDAPSTGVFVSFVRPAGAGAPQLEPVASCGAACRVPGDRMMVSGEERTFELRFTMPAGTAAGSYTGSASVYATTDSGTVSDANPADNSAPFEFVVDA